MWFRRLFLPVVISLLALVVCAAIGLFVSVKHYNFLIPNYSSLNQYTPPLVSRVYTVDGKMLSEYYLEKRVFVPIEAIPKPLINAFLSAEDKTFYQHKGLDFLGIIRAAITNIRNIGSGRRLVGASTITQQVAKNMLLGSKVSISRKIKEAILATIIDASIPKNKILELYLNQIYLGIGADGTSAYGVAVAAQSYFDKSLGELTLGECAYLAGLAKGAANYSIKKAPQRAKDRRNWVIDRMLFNKAISENEATDAKSELLKLTPVEERQQLKAEYFSEEVRRFLIAKFGTENVYSSGYTTHVTLDSKIQAIAERCLCEGLLEFDRKYGWRGPVTNLDISKYETDHEVLAALRDILKNLPKLSNSWTIGIVKSISQSEASVLLYDESKGRIHLKELKWARKSLGKSLLGPAVKKVSDVLKTGDVIWVERLDKDRVALRQVPKVQGAIIVMNPINGRVIAMHGGYDYGISEYNRATQAVRQPGSIIKPFIYLTAMDVGFSPSTTIYDGPITVELGPGQGVWQPRNVTRKFFGDVTLRFSLERSVNNATVALSQKIGLKPIAETLHKFDILNSPNIYPSTVLGAGETTLIKLARAYSILANGGKDVTPMIIDQVQDKYGKVIFKGDPRSCVQCQHIGPMSDNPPEISEAGHQIFDPISIYQVTYMLEGAVKRGSAIRARHLDFPFACKTGTTSNSEDTWVFGYTPNLVVGIYIGFDKPESLGDKVLGANLPLPILIKFMEQIDQQYKMTPFKVPKGVVFRKVDLLTGEPNNEGKGAIYEAFREVPLNKKGLYGQDQNNLFTTDSISNILDESEEQAPNAPGTFTGKPEPKSGESKRQDDDISSLIE